MTIEDANANTLFRSLVRVTFAVKEAGFVEVNATKKKLAEGRVPRGVRPLGHDQHQETLVELEFDKNEWDETPVRVGVPEFMTPVV